MVDTFAQTLNHLMGHNRNATSSTEISNEHFTSPKVCKFALVSFCPHELFPNTKFDMGVCLNRHDEFFKKQFNQMPEEERNTYERKYIDETIRKLS